jgi:hypothetical protein
MSKEFPDLTGDGKVTQADILKGRKVFAGGGSLMLPIERQQRSAGGVILKQVLKAISNPKTSKAKTITTELKEKYDPSEIEEMAESFVEAVENNTKMTSKGTQSLKTPLANIAQEAADTLNENRDVTKNFIDAKDIIKISRLDDLRAGGGGKTDNILDSIIQSVGSVTERPSVMGSFIPDEAAGTRPVRKSQVIAGTGAAAAALTLRELAGSAWNMLNDKPPVDKKEATAFEKAFSAAFNAGEETFTFDGKEYTTEVRKGKAHGGSMTLLLPVENMKSDMEMEEDYVSFVMDETLSDDEMEYVNKALESDNRLSELFDKIVLASAEFTGAGEVDGPGTGTSDDIPARLSDGEFVFTKKAVDQIGVETLEGMMKDAEAEYDASRKDMAVGGIMNDPTQDEKAMLPDEAMSDDEIEEQMLESNRIPSLMRR